MSELSDRDEIMLIPNLIEQFRRGDISHDEMWQQINQELVCHQHICICIDPSSCVGQLQRYA